MEQEKQPLSSLKDSEKESTLQTKPGGIINFSIFLKSLNLSQLILPGAIVLAAIIISGTLLYVNLGKGDRGGAAQIGGPVGQGVLREVSTDDDPFLGDKDAPVTIIEFSDYQCPFCRRFWTDTLPQLKDQYLNTGKARLIYRDFPLDFHLAAQAAAETAECAGDQERYWEMHDKIFNEQGRQGEGTISFTEQDLKQWAKEIGLKTKTFNQCLTDGKYRNEVKKDLEDGVRAGVSGTPTFFINGRVLVGAQPLAAFQAIIEEELKKAE